MIVRSTDGIILCIIFLSARKDFQYSHTSKVISRDELTFVDRKFYKNEQTTVLHDALAYYEYEINFHDGCCIEGEGMGHDTTAEVSL